jgi:hypothetical protein
MQAAKIDAQHTDAVDDALDRFGDHEGVTRGRILRWLSQFADEDVALAVKSLEHVRYYDAARVRAMTRQLVRIVRDEFRRTESRRIVFVPVGDVGSSAGVVARVLSDLREGPRCRVVAMRDLGGLDPKTVSVIVLVDAFSGTGKQLAEWWEVVEPLVRPMGAAVVVGLLVLNGKARPKIQGFARLLCVDELLEDADVLSAACQTFDGDEKEALLDYCKNTGTDAEFVRGYGECGLLVAFKHGCPNNSLPILWWDSKSWRQLFKRRAI